jgi:ubiquinone/menaquinone biosynthesis C-methylase UbiE
MQMQSEAATDSGSQRPHVCPWWLGYFLVSPLRRLVENPEKLLGPHVQPGMQVLEVGCGMGFFTLPLARLAGPQGRIVCVDLQPRMLSALARRARRAGLTDRIEMRQCDAESLGLADRAGTFDLAVLIYVLHEIPDKAGALRDVRAALKPEGRVLFIEPTGHVKPAAFEAELEMATAAGLAVERRLTQRRQFGAVLRVATR